MTTAVGILQSQWAESCARTRRIVDGLTDAEFFWEPCAGCWTVRRTDSGWWMDYPPEEPDPPPPVTTIAWRLLHITHANWIYWEQGFGPRGRHFPDLEIMGTAQDAAADLAASQEPVTATLASIVDLDRPVATPMGETWPAHRVFTTLIDEQVHHGAEISLLRDLHRETVGP